MLFAFGIVQNSEHFANRTAPFPGGLHTCAILVRSGGLLLPRQHGSDAGHEALLGSVRGAPPSQCGRGDALQAGTGALLWPPTPRWATRLRASGSAMDPGRGRAGRARAAR
jgi:hypothetical protein